MRFLKITFCKCCRFFMYVFNKNAMYTSTIHLKIFSYCLFPPKRGEEECIANRLMENSVLEFYTSS